MAKQVLQCTHEDGCVHQNGVAHMYVLNQVQANQRLGRDRWAKMTWSVVRQSVLCPAHAQVHETRHGNVWKLETVRVACGKWGIKIPRAGSTTNGPGDGRFPHRRRVV